MIAKDRGRKAALALVAASAFGALPARQAAAQIGQMFQKPGRASTAPAQGQGQAQAKTPPPAVKVTEAAYPTNPSDAIAIVNGAAITRQRLADECVARKGQEILETLIARTLIEQALAAKKQEVTPAEIDEEIDRVAMQTAQLDREKWLEVLFKERGISPAQYARDIIYPGLALRKLAGPRVQITEKDLKEAYEANHGPRLRCRIIMTDTMTRATQIWEELRKNPDSFDKVAKLKSMDTSTRALGGMLPEPIARFANPKAVSKAAFEQLVDGDLRDTNPGHKPKDGDITGPIQVNESAWLIMKREELLPGPPGKFEDKRIRERLEAQVFEVKLNEAMEDVFREIHEASSIDNKLTGFIRHAHEEQDPEFRAGLDQDVKRASEAGVTKAILPTAARNVGSPGKVPTGPVTPAGVPSSAASAANNLKNTIKNAPPGSAASTPPGN